MVQKNWQRQTKMKSNWSKSKLINIDLNQTRFWSSGFELISICGLTYRQLLVCFLRPNMDRGLETFGLDATYIDTLLHRFNARLLLCLWTGDCVVCALAWLFSFFDICDKHGVGQTKHALISEESCERELTTNKSLDMLNVETVSRAIVATRAQA